jgi:hypothetical protein
MGKAKASGKSPSAKGDQKAATARKAAGDSAKTPNKLTISKKDKSKANKKVCARVWLSSALPALGTTAPYTDDAFKPFAFPFMCAAEFWAEGGDARVCGCGGNGPPHGFRAQARPQKGREPRKGTYHIQAECTQSAGAGLDTVPEAIGVGKVHADEDVP